mgnify:CR=1 FL=1
MNLKEINMAKGKIVSGSTVDVYLTILRGLSEELREAESTVDELRDRKWDCVKLLKDLGHDFTASSEGMDVVLSAPPSMRF